MTNLSLTERYTSSNRMNQRGEALEEFIKNLFCDGYSEAFSYLGESCGLELSKTKELARVNRVDPLGITDLRVRGMWGIKNPTRVFDYLELPEGDIFSAYFVMTEEKFSSFSFKDRKYLEELVKEPEAKISFKDVAVKSPNNPAKSIKAKVIYICK